MPGLSGVEGSEVVEPLLTLTRENVNCQGTSPVAKQPDRNDLYVTMSGGRSSSAAAVPTLLTNDTNKVAHRK